MTQIHYILLWRPKGSKVWTHVKRDAILSMQVFDIDTPGYSEIHACTDDGVKLASLRVSELSKKHPENEYTCGVVSVAESNAEAQRSPASGDKLPPLVGNSGGGS